jgi:hypothetical protein
MSTKLAKINPIYCYLRQYKIIFKGHLLGIHQLFSIHFIQFYLDFNSTSIHTTKKHVDKTNFWNMKMMAVVLAFMAKKWG